MPEHSSAPNLAAMSSLARSKAGELRNLVGSEDLDSWLAEIGERKLGPLPQANRRQSLAWRWLTTVARRRMAREGQALPVERAELAALADTLPWVAKALAAGTSVQRLVLSPGEALDIEDTLDWMRAADGPNIDSDWSRISYDQARQGREQWVASAASRAQKAQSTASAMDGCELLLASLSGDGSEWLWVEVKSQSALELEGANMRHCVGSYADLVEEGRARILSLRDPSGKPKLTLEVSAPDPATGVAKIEQARRFSNAFPIAQDARHIGALLAHMEREGHPMEPGARSGLAAYSKGATFGWMGPRFGASRMWLAGDARDDSDALAATIALAGQIPLVELALAARGLANLGYVKAAQAAREQIFAAAQTLAASSTDKDWPGIDAILADSGPWMMLLPGTGEAIRPGPGASDAIAKRSKAGLEPLDAARIVSRMSGADGAEPALGHLRSSVGDEMARLVASADRRAAVELAGALLASRDPQLALLGERTTLSLLGSCPTPSGTCAKMLALGFDASHMVQGLEHEPLDRLLCLRNDFLASGMEAGARKTLAALMAKPDEAFETPELAAQHRHAFRELLWAIDEIGHVAARFALHRTPALLAEDPGLLAIGQSLSDVGPSRVFLTGAYAVAKLTMDLAKREARSGQVAPGLAGHLLSVNPEARMLGRSNRFHSSDVNPMREALAQAIHSGAAQPEQRSALIDAVTDLAYLRYNHESSYLNWTGADPLWIQDQPPAPVDMKAKLSNRPRVGIDAPTPPTP